MSIRKILVLYKSKYGATKRYVDMLRSKVSCDIIDLNNPHKIVFKNYDTIILTGGIYAAGIAGISFLRKNYNLIKDKKVAILSVGASPYDEKAIEEMKAKNLKENLKNIPVFYARGAWDESKMDLKDKLMCKMLERVIKKKDPSTYEPWMKAFADSIGKQCDWVSEESIEPLIDYINLKTKEL